MTEVDNAARISHQMRVVTRWLAIDDGRRIRACGTRKLLDTLGEALVSYGEMRSHQRRTTSDRELRAA